MQLKVKPILASFAVLALLSALPGGARADGLLQKGDLSHPLPAFQVQTTAGGLQNGDTLVMHFAQGSTATTGTGTFNQPDTTNQPGAEVFTFSSADMAGLAYGYVLCQPVDTTNPSNIINPYLVNLVAFNPYDVNLAMPQLAAVKSATVLNTGAITSATTPTATSVSTTLTAATDIISGDGVVFTSGVDSGKIIHVLVNSAGLFTFAGAGLPAAPAAGDTFVLIPFSKALVGLLATLGPDSKPILSSSDTQAGAEASGAITSAGIPAATVANMKSDTQLAGTFNRTHGSYTYNETTHVMTLLNDNGTTYTTVTLTYDNATGTITGKQ